MFTLTASAVHARAHAVPSASTSSPRGAPTRVAHVAPSKSFAGKGRPTRSSHVAKMGTDTGNPFVDGWLDLTDTVSGGGKDLGVSELAEKLGKDVYMDINGWHLFLRDAKYAGPLARIVQNTIAADGNRFEERSIENILKNCPVKIGGGKQTVMLYDLMPNMVVQDFMSICERYADDMAYMEATREVARRAAKMGILTIEQKGEQVDSIDGFKGPIRLRLAKNGKDWRNLTVMHECMESWERDAKGAEGADTAVHDVKAEERAPEPKRRKI